MHQGILRSVARSMAARSIALILSASSVGFLDIASAQAEMTFQAVPLGDSQACGKLCPTIIRATGEITPDTPAAFVDFVARTYGRHARKPVVFLDSMGGRVVASMQLGFALRKLHAMAIVAGAYPDGTGGTILTNAQCFSACVYAFMGASSRVVPPRSQIGIHRMFLLEQGISADGTLSVQRRRFDTGGMKDFLMHYSQEMGVDPALIAEAEHIPSGNLHLLSRSEMRRFHLADAKL